MRTIVLNQAGWINTNQYNYNFSVMEELLKFYDHASRVNLSLNQIHFIIYFDEKTRIVRSIVKKFNDGHEKMAQQEVSKCYFRPILVSREKVIAVGKPLHKYIVERLNYLERTEVMNHEN